MQYNCNMQYANAIGFFVCEKYALKIMFSDVFLKI